MKCSILLMLVCVAAGCSKSGSANTAATDRDLTVNPVAVAMPTVSDANVTLWGVHLGDGADAIPADQVLQTNANGIRQCKGDRDIRVAGGKVVQFILLGKDDLDKFGVKSEPDIERVFGKADRVTTEDAGMISETHVYWYPGKRMTVSWAMHPAGSFGPISIGDRLN